MNATKLYLILFFAVFFLSGCEEDKGFLPEESSGISLLLSPLRASASDDDDNLPEEYEIKNLSIFLADAGSNTISDKFVHQAYSPVSGASIKNCKLVNLPLDPATLVKKDIYVIANCADILALNAILTVSDIKALKTPQATSANGLTTGEGLPMYGQSLDTDLSSASTGNPPTVMLVRACAKLRITLIYTNSSWIGAENKCKMDNVAPYTFYCKNDGFKLDAADLIAYPTLDMTPISPQQYQGVIYIYESLQLPRLHIYMSP
ncbi:fimbrial protein [Viscerimonas tarda]